MNIVVIHGQNHKGSTYNISKLLLNNITCEKSIIEYFLPRDLNHFCLGCYKCIEDVKTCPFNIEKEIILNNILKADLIIITSPNYCMMPSAPLKAFLELFFVNWVIHKPYKEMLSKKAVVISTTAGKGAKKVCKLIKDNLDHWLIPQTYTKAYQVQAMNWPMVPPKIKDRITNDMEKLGAKLSQNKKVHVGIKTKIIFNFGKLLQKASWGASIKEKEYWQENGWLNGKKPWKD